MVDKLIRLQKEIQSCMWMKKIYCIIKAYIEGPIKKMEYPLIKHVFGQVLWSWTTDCDSKKIHSFKMNHTIVSSQNDIDFRIQFIIFLIMNLTFYKTTALYTEAFTCIKWVACIATLLLHQIKCCSRWHAIWRPHQPLNSNKVSSSFNES